MPTSHLRHRPQPYTPPGSFLPHPARPHSLLLQPASSGYVDPNWCAAPTLASTFRRDTAAVSAPSSATTPAHRTAVSNAPSDTGRGTTAAPAGWHRATGSPLHGSAQTSPGKPAPNGSPSSGNTASPTPEPWPGQWSLSEPSPIFAPCQEPHLQERPPAKHRPRRSTSSRPQPNLAHHPKTPFPRLPQPCKY
jgi:hypothetical protein